ncbi:hypothetical protein COO60DRAFT_598618 [Scenedesmus sp. NREL 46B-D3]|nr:hypothetical protein COO60DRAFT_598618 [Scenedesmus sp. NREL 46B-D3]
MRRCHVWLRMLDLVALYDTVLHAAEALHFGACCAQEQTASVCCLLCIVQDQACQHLCTFKPVDVQLKPGGCSCWLQFCSAQLGCLLPEAAALMCRSPLLWLAYARPCICSSDIKHCGGKLCNVQCCKKLLCSKRVRL